MDTRRKIGIGVGPAAIATGTFNPLRAAHARAIEDFREQNAVPRLLVIVLPAEPELLPMGARVELVAALRPVDSVIGATPEQAEELIRTLRPMAVLRMEQDDRLRTRQLIEMVRSKA